MEYANRCRYLAQDLLAITGNYLVKKSPDVQGAARLIGCARELLLTAFVLEGYDATEKK